MPIAQTVTLGVKPATFNNKEIPELGIEIRKLDVMHDIHFGVSLVNDELKNFLDTTDPLESDLVGFGPRIIDIVRRGGRTAEDDWLSANSVVRVRKRGVGDPFGVTKTGFDSANYVAIKNHTYPSGAKINAKDMSGQERYAPNAVFKAHATGNEFGVRNQFGTRWSKTALEDALAHGQGHIHFHLDGMGDLAPLLNKGGDYGYNVTSRELRYVRRFWQRFQHKVIFYNGYDGSLNPVRVQPPWLPEWKPNANECKVCDKPFSRIFPVRKPHHCRLCGECVCDDCSPNRHRLLYPVKRTLRDSSPYRVCDPCHLQFVRGQPIYI